MKTLENLSPKKGSNQKKRRIGRGIGSGWGKTAAKGHKGQKARKGGTVAAGFEGGQTPLYRRLPKRGFKNMFRTDFDVVNLDLLNRFDGEVTPKGLSAAGLIKNTSTYVKILGRGKLEKSLKISVHKVSKSAQAAIEAAGCTLEILPVKTERKRSPEKTEKKQKGKAKPKK